ncbi:MAG: substrate-binding domain-containing protein, partial [Helicobacteraceae bacterium]|nr:substrate-binding domain-containing protein [Helicobacteraceae bacterium]
MPQANKSGEPYVAKWLKILRRIGAFFGKNNYLWSLVYAPIVAQFIAFIWLVYQEPTPFEAALAAIAIVVFSLGYFRSKKLEVKDGYFKTYFPLFLPIAISAFNYYLGYSYQIYELVNLYVAGNTVVYAFTIANLIYILAIYMIALFYSPLYFAAITTTVSCAYAAGFAFGLYGKKIAVANKKSIYFSLATLVILFLPLAPIAIYKNSYTLSSKIQSLDPIGKENNRIYRGGDQSEDYRALRGEPAIYFENNLPKLDGATAFYPIYASAAKALYKKPDNLDENRFKYNYFNLSTTEWAYGKLINGSVDLIFVLAPAPGQLKQVAARIDADLRVPELTFTPIGKEAFVFLVNEHNPIRSLTIEQIQKIYTGEITNWREVGGNDAKIMPFQRNEYSGSQATMKNGVMKGLELIEPFIETIRGDMGGLIDAVADYRNAENAIGYSFRFFVTDMMKAQGVRLLAINGVEPT